MDIYCKFGEDFQLTPQGDIQIAEGWDEVSQAIIREALTNPAQQQASGIFSPADDIWDVNYGLGLRAFVDEPYSAALNPQMADLVAKACLNNDAVSSVTPPIVNVSNTVPDEISIETTVTLQVGEVQTLTVEVP